MSELTGDWDLEDYAYYLGVGLIYIALGAICILGVRVRT